MNRLEAARARILAIHQACRENKDPPLDPDALRMLREVVSDDDAMRVYQLAENTVREGYHHGCDDVLAAEIAVDHWTRTVAWTLKVTGKPMVPLAETGMYPPRLDPRKGT